MLQFYNLVQVGTTEDLMLMMKQKKEFQETLNKKVQSKLLNFFESMKTENVSDENIIENSEQQTKDSLDFLEKILNETQENNEEENDSNNGKKMGKPSVFTINMDSEDIEECYNDIVVNPISNYQRNISNQLQKIEAIDISVAPFIVPKGEKKEVKTLYAKFLSLFGVKMFQRQFKPYPYILTTFKMNVDEKNTDILDKVKNVGNYQYRKIVETPSKEPFVDFFDLKLPKITELGYYLFNNLFEMGKALKYYDDSAFDYTENVLALMKKLDYTFPELETAIKNKDLPLLKSLIFSKPAYYVQFIQVVFKNMAVFGDFESLSVHMNYLSNPFINTSICYSRTVEQERKIYQEYKNTQNLQN